MTSVRNRLPLLSGNRWLVVLFIVLLIAACSPKTRWVSNPANKPVNKPAAATACAAACKNVRHLRQRFRLFRCYYLSGWIISAPEYLYTRYQP